MTSGSAMPSCPLCRTRAHRVSWHTGRGGGPVRVTLQPCGHVVTCAAEPEILLQEELRTAPEATGRPA
ncbi:hypothetical protein [Streptomyces sp. WAC06614]|uniref:hypothetical protein n=1 Tax=Streptomyces sp. WAC06614 TaxID=2487416 RepID=UPI000F79CAC0|nr:hypothetical protein [Streptomyces sp. WAC06614]RSS50193.1 hypothetical protein EF918_35855 [Streptomyces sp. WAC06614]